MIKGLKLDALGEIMYTKKEYHCRDLIEIEMYRSANYGAPGKKRGKKKKATPEEIRAGNERTARKKLRRLINTNFEQGDIHLILTYQKELRPTPQESKRILRNFKDALARRYKKHGKVFKWILVTEYKNKAIHHHMIINSPDGYDPSKDIAAIWTRGRPKETRLDDSGNYSQLADYLIKETEKTFREEDSPQKARYSHSRNLLEPKVRKKTVRAKSWKKISIPKGFVLLPDTFYEGINPVTGYRFREYTLQKIPIRKGKETRGG